jgi:hypothetical protein
MIELRMNMTQSEPTVKSNYVEAYLDLSRRYRFYSSGKIWLLTLCAVPAVIFRNGLGIIVMMLLAWVVYAASIQLIRTFRCPRCQHYYFGEGKIESGSLPNGKCVHCELPLTPKHAVEEDDPIPA